MAELDTKNGGECKKISEKRILGSGTVDGQVQQAR